MKKIRASKGSQIPLRLPDSDSASRVSRQTLAKLALWRGASETETIHYALKRLAAEVLPDYESDDGPLTGQQVEAIRELAGPLATTEVCSSLFEE